LPEFAVSDKAMSRFLREVDVAAALKHPNIVEFIDRGVHNGVVYLVTEFATAQMRQNLLTRAAAACLLATQFSIITQGSCAVSRA